MIQKPYSISSTNFCIVLYFVSHDAMRNCHVSHHLCWCEDYDVLLLSWTSAWFWLWLTSRSLEFSCLGLTVACFYSRVILPRSHGIKPVQYVDHQPPSGHHGWVSLCSISLFSPTISRLTSCLCSCRSADLPDLPHPFPIRSSFQKDILLGFSLDNHQVLLWCYISL